MDYVKVILPCGFSVNYQDILYNSNKFPCPACKTHDITREECLNMTRNKLVLQEKSFEFKKNHYVELRKEFEKYENDPKYYITESYDSLKREVDHRREEIKAIINKKIDDIHDELLEKIDMERDLKLKELEEKIQKAQSFDLAFFEIDENFDIHSTLEFYRKNIIEIDNDISLVQNIIDDLNEPTFKLADFNDDINIEKIFGELYSKGERIQLIINNFSLLMDKKKLRINSKKFVFRNLEWNIQIRLNENDGWMEFYVYCNPIEESNEFSVNVTAELTLLNKSDSKKDLIKNMVHLYTKHQGYGSSKFTTINKIMNRENGYYDANNDSIILKAVLNFKSE